MSNIFKSPRRMLGRAKHHLAEFEKQIDTFVKQKNWTPAFEPGPNGKEHLLKIKFGTRLAEDLPNIVFDCVNNLRAALDQTAFGIAVKHTGISNPKSAKFPFGPTETDMRNNVAGGCKDLPAEISDLFASFKPYKGGNNTLWGMNELCNAPKHKTLYPIGMGGGVGVSPTGPGPINIVGGFGLVGGEWDSEKHELIFARFSDPNAVQGQLNFNMSFSVAFDDVDQVIRGQHPIEALRAMTGEVDRVLMTTERECRRIGLIV